MIKLTNNKKKISFWTLSVLVTLLVIWIFPRQLPIAYVSKAELKTARDEVLGTVEIKQYHIINLKFERGGVVNYENAEVGQAVSKNELLMELDTEMLTLEQEELLIDQKYFQLESKLQRPDELKLKRALNSLRRTKSRYDQGVIPLERYEIATKNYKISRNDLERTKLAEKLDESSRKNDIKKYQYSIDRMSLRSPIDGIIIDVSSRIGDVVNQGQSVMKIMDDRRLIVGLIGEEDFDKIEVGLPLELRLKAFPNRIFNGEVEQILPKLEPESKKFEIYIKSDVDQKMLIPGLTGEVIIIADQRQDAIVVPSQAVFEDTVLTVEDNRIKKNKITKGFVGLLEIEILDGLEEGDLVVTEDSYRFKEEQWVRTRWE